MIIKKQRAAIIAEYEEATGERFNREGFLLWVQQRPEHPAYQWFEWDDSKAGHQYRLGQAGHFAQGIRLNYEIVVVRAEQPFRQVASAPAMISPLPTRGRPGGGFIHTDLDNAEHVSEFARLAATDLRAWSTRYEAVMHLAGIEGDPLGPLLDALDRLVNPPYLMAAE